LEGLPASIVRAYRGQQADANQMFQSEAADLSHRGYVPSSQSWAGADRTGAIVGSLFGLAVGFWGIFVVGARSSAGIAIIIAGALTAVVSQALAPNGGTLTVSYGREPGSDAPAGQAEGDSIVRDPGPSKLVDRIRQLDEALEAGVISADEHATKRASIIDDL
jgi:hypothetical protein